jgi:hypothetical protein
MVGGHDHGPTIHMGIEWSIGMKDRLGGMKALIIL